MYRIAHRGCAARYPENTVRAITASGFHLGVVEIDVRRCATSELVVFHDERVDRLTNSTGLIRDYTLSELRKLTIEESHSIPTLQEVTATVSSLPWPVELQVELKEKGLFADARRVLDPIENRVRYTSFDRGCLQSFSSEASDAPYTYGILVAKDQCEMLEFAVEFSCDSFHPSVTACRESDIAHQAAEKDFTVIAWGGTTREAVQHVADAGVDAVTIDDWQW